MKTSIGLMIVIAAVWCLLCSANDIHCGKYHFDGYIHAIEKDSSNGNDLDTEENRLAILNNNAGKNYYIVFAVLGGMLLAIGLQLYVQGVHED